MKKKNIQIYHCAFFIKKIIHEELILKKNKVKKSPDFENTHFSGAHLNRIFSTSYNNLKANDALHPQILFF